MASTETHDDIERIYEQWHEHASNRNGEKLLDLYAPDAVLESPLIPEILDQEEGICRGRDEIRHFLEEGAERRPDELVRWYRTDEYFTDGNTLIWEYPRETPDGEQVDILEVMEIEDGQISHQRIYWGWFGFNMFQDN